MHIILPGEDDGGWWRDMELSGAAESVSTRVLHSALAI